MNSTQNVTIRKKENIVLNTTEIPNSENESNDFDINGFRDSMNGNNKSKEKYSKSNSYRRQRYNYESFPDQSKQWKKPPRARRIYSHNNSNKDENDSYDLRNIPYKVTDIDDVNDINTNKNRNIRNKRLSRLMMRKIH